MHGKMLFIAIIRKFKFSFKGMAKKTIWDTTSNIISTIADRFNVPMKATKPIFVTLFPVLCIEIDSAFTYMAWFWLMHVLYSKQIDKTKLYTYLECVNCSAILNK